MTTASHIAARSAVVVDPYVVLVEIVTSSLALRLTDDLSPQSYDGNVYQPWPVRVTFGAVGVDRHPSAVLEVSNVSQAVASALRPLSSVPICNLRVARLARGEYVTLNGEYVTLDGEPITIGGSAENYNVQSIEGELLGLAIDSVEYTASTARCRLGMEWDFSREKHPPLRHDGRFVGLWS